MSVKAKRLIKKIISYSGILFFILAAGMLWWQLRNYSLSDIIFAILNIPLANLVMACFACMLGYLTLALYDFLALNYVGGHVSWWKWMLAGMLSFAISNNAGHAVVSGGAIRYRLYTRWRIRGGDIFKMLTISGFTYFLGASAIVVISYFLIPHSMFDDSIGASIGINTLFFFCLISLLAYFIVSIVFHKKNIKIAKLEFQIPSIQMALTQTFLGIMDSVLAGLVLYFCLTPFVEIPFPIFMGLFAIAQSTGVFSQVPGGIGVFETVFLIGLPDTVDKANIFGALLAFRIIYYVLPLIGMGSLFFIYERWLHSRMKRWLNEAKEKIPTKINRIKSEIKNRK